LLSRVGGVVVVLLGLSVLGIVKIPWMQRGRQVTLIDRPVGVGGAVLVGMAFGLGWTPCIGPVLAAILMYAASIQGAAEGAILLLVYALGLGVPFVASAAGLGSALRVLGGTSRVARIANVTSGVMLLAVGGLMLTDQLAAIVAPALRWMAWPVQLQ
jgi:cytochrome c-type biogenesis protein